MANELNAGIGVTGLTVTAQLINGGTTVGSPIACPEVGATGIYSGDMTGPAGTYGVAFFADSVLRVYGLIRWDGATEIVSSSPMENADALLDGEDAIETGLTLRQALRLLAAAAAGKLSGGNTATNVIRNAVADTKDRIVATVDKAGNRTAIAVDLT